MKGKDFCVSRTKKQVAEPVVGSRYVLGKYKALDKLIRWIVQEHDKEQLTPSFYQFPSTNWMTSYSPILFRCSVAQQTFIFSFHDSRRPSITNTACAWDRQPRFVHSRDWSNITPTCQDFLISKRHIRSRPELPIEEDLWASGSEDLAEVKYAS